MWKSFVQAYGLPFRLTTCPFDIFSADPQCTTATSVVEGVPFRPFFCKATAFRACRVVNTPVSTSRSRRCPDENNS